MNDKTVRQKKGSAKASTQLYLPIAEIKDSTVILKNGGLRSVLQTSSVNFNLKSEDEQNALIYSFQGFLNTLDFPVQILIRSRKLDVDNYIDGLYETASKQMNPLLKKQTMEYAEYIKKLVEYADIMEKNFFVIIPMDPMRAQGQNMFQQTLSSLRPNDSLEAIRQRHREFAKLRKKLNTRSDLIKSGLSSCNLRIEELDTKKLIELFFKIYNPITSRNQKFKDGGSVSDVNLLTN